MRLNCKLAVLMVLIVVLSLFFSLSCHRKKVEKGGEALSQAVILTTPQKKSFSVTFDSASTAAAFRVASVTPKVSANIVKIYVKKGDRVKTGTILAQLDKTDYEIGASAARAQVSAAEAGVMQAEAALYKLNNDYKRYKKLKEDGSIAESDFESIESGYKQAEAALAAAKAQVKMAKSALNNYEQQLSYTTIRAPFDGYISSKTGEIGEMAAAGRPLFEVVQSDRLKVSAFVSELEIYGITKDSVAEIFFDAYPDMEPEKAKVNFINSKVNAATKSVEVEFLVDNSKMLYKPGMTVRVRLTLPERNYLVIPRNAIFTRDNEVGIVYVKTEENRVYTKNIVMGGSVEGYSIVKSGLEGNEEVVVGGGRRLEDGQRVTVIESAQTTN